MVQFKDRKAWEEWAHLVEGGYMVVPLVLYAEHISMTRFNSGIVITHVFRSDEEQKALCESLGIEYYPTVHSHWRGVDLRSRIYSVARSNELAEAVSQSFVYGRGKRSAIYHNVGAGPHIHLQAPSKKGPWNG